MTIRFAPQARAEFAEAARWYAAEAGIERATAFRNEIHRILRLLSDHPDMGTPAAARTLRMTIHPTYIDTKQIPRRS